MTTNMHYFIPMTMDFVKLMLAWMAEDEQNALDNGGELVLEINQVIRELEHQREAIDSLLSHLSTKLYPDWSEPVSSTLRPDERVRIIKGRIDSLVAEGYTSITPQQVLDRLGVDYLDIGVTHPTSVIATVLAKMIDFKRVRKGVYEYVGEAVKGITRPNK
jgi:hypothetical protein